MPGTDLSELAKEYLQLGGQRRAVIDDNHVSTRIWDPEPEAARQFWQDCIEPLPERQKQQLELFLPTINRH